MLEIRNLSKEFENPYGDPNRIFNDFNIKINDGEFVVIIGSNGTGKSTLLNIISGILEQTEGDILLDGKNISNKPEYERTKYIGRVFQNPSLGTCPTMTVKENLSLAMNKGKLLNLKKCLRYNSETLEELLKGVSLDLKSFLDVKVKFLSGGQRQSISLIMSSLSNPSILLLDEHTAALDPKTSNEVMELTDKIVRKNNITTLMVTHNLKHALEYGDRLIMLHKGNIILDLNKEEKDKLSVEQILEKFEFAV
ncbi:MAG: ATP-binding cassette domain-containing protein [Clostridioides sp.]|nr:ATP-binding cassette domain-containing protein [Clostridioides sp.]